MKHSLIYRTLGSVCQIVIGASPGEMQIFHNNQKILQTRTDEILKLIKIEESERKEGGKK